MGSNSLKAGRPSAKKKQITLQELKGDIKTTRLNVEISKDLHTKLKMHAAENDVKIREIVATALKDHLM